MTEREKNQLVFILTLCKLLGREIEDLGNVATVRKEMIQKVNEFFAF